MEKKYNLSEAREQLEGSLSGGKVWPITLHAIFTAIKRQDEEFIRRLKEEIDRLTYSEEEIEKFPVTEQQRTGFNLGLFSVREHLDILAGDKLTHPQVNSEITSKVCIDTVGDTSPQGSSSVTPLTGKLQVSNPAPADTQSKCECGTNDDIIFCQDCEEETVEIIRDRDGNITELRSVNGECANVEGK